METFDYIILTIAAVLLLPPAFLGSALSKELRERKEGVDGRTPIIPPEISNKWLPSALTLITNWVDLIRTGAASYILGYYWIHHRPAEAPEIEMGYIAAAVVGLGILLQTFRFLGKGAPTIVTPVFYASGAVFAVSEFTVALVAVIFGWTFACVARRGLVLAPVLSVVLGIATFIVSPLNPPAIIVAGLILFGPFCSVMFSKRPVIACRSPLRGAARPRR